MRKKIVLMIFTCGLLILNGVISVGHSQDVSERIEVMKKELNRNFEILQKEAVPPYYMSYSIDSVRIQSVSGTFGAVMMESDNETSYLRVDIRTGSYHLDSSHEIRGRTTTSILDRLGESIPAPIQESPDALQVILWRETDRAYKNAVQSLARVNSQQRIMVEEEDASDDFSKVEPHVSLQKPVEISVNLDRWADKVRKYTEEFNQYPFIMGSSASFRNEIRNKYFVNTEGTSVLTPAVYMNLQVAASVKADDGMEMPLYLSYFGFEESDFPSDDKVLEDVRSMIDTLEKLRSAPLVEPYSGPAILSGKASGVFFHEILGHRLEGHRQKSEAEGQTFKKQVGKPILPEFLSVIFDPTIKELDNFKLSGFYNFDDEGSPAHKVVSVDKGVLEGFLMSRSPIENFPQSNGHARGQPGRKPVSRQSNLIVRSEKTMPEDQLRQALIEECVRQDKDFGLIFTEISGGQTITSRTSPNAFNVTPLVVYRIFRDGRPDELVRGVDLIGTPLTTFGKIIATGSEKEVFNGMCGAESGSVPVSAVSPSLLLSEIEVQKKSKSQTTPPILSPPPISPGNIQ